jgi:uncharacterized damage-inducible protein DinB
MGISQSLLPEFDHEMGNTRKTLERVPEDKLGWKPHEKSGTMGWLSSHLANIPAWTAFTIDQDSLDVAPVGQPKYETPQARSRKELLEFFDQNVASGRAALARASDENLVKSWTLLSGGKTVLTMPRIAVLRSFILNHNVHHRAQLGVYLRLNNIPVPAIYGPSADEAGM